MLPVLTLLLFLAQHLVFISVFFLMHFLRLTNPSTSSAPPPLPIPILFLLFLPLRLFHILLSCFFFIISFHSPSPSPFTHHSPSRPYTVRKFWVGKATTPPTVYQVWSVPSGSEFYIVQNDELTWTKPATWRNKSPRTFLSADIRTWTLDKLRMWNV